MYACNITGEIDEMLRRHDAIITAGGTCVMVSMNSIGLAGSGGVATALPRGDPPATENGWGMYSRSPAHWK